MENLQSDKTSLNKSLTEAGATFSLASILPALASLVIIMPVSAILGENYQSNQWYRYLLYLIPQLCFALSAAVYFARNKNCVKVTFHACKWYYYAVAIALQFGLFFSLSELNGLFMEFLQKLGYHQAVSTLPDVSGWNLLPALLVIAVLPAVCEELIFRGILTQSMRQSGWGTCAAVFVTGALFSLFHGNPEQTLYQFACGVSYSLLAWRSGSVFPTMIAHFLNNAVILFFTAFGFQSLWEMPKVMYVCLFVASAIALVGSLLFLGLFHKKESARGVKDGKRFFFACSVGILVCALNWIVALITGLQGG